MEAFYEESAVNSNAKSGERRYKLFHILSNVFLTLAIFLLVIGIFNFPWQVNSEEAASWRFLVGFIIVLGFSCLTTWFIFYKIKSRFNVSYDYCFVSGELRISQVFNINKRKLIARFDCADMIQVGDMENPSYERFRSDPNVKEIICTPNIEPANGKFFMYILVDYNGKKLFLLECRENLLMNIMKFAKRSVLESDYVMQERKQR